MARARIAIRITRNLERDLAAIEAFLAEAGVSKAYDALLEALAGTVIPNLEKHPRIGRPFLERPAHSIEARERIRSLKARTGAGELREHLSGDYFLLYALIATTAYLLAIKHHRQLSFDLGAHWLSP